MLNKFVQAFMLMVLLLVSLTGCGGSDKPFIATGDGEQTTEEVSKSASEQVEGFFAQLTPIIGTVVKSMSEIGNMIFTSLPGVGIDTSEVEKIRQQIKDKENGGTQ